MSNVAFQACFLTLLVVLYVLIPIGVIFFASIPPLNKYIAVVLSLLVARIISDMWRTGREGELYTGSHFIWRYLPPAISTVIVIFAFVNNIMSLIPLGGTPPGSPFFTQVNRDLLNFVLITYLAVRRLIDDIIKRLEKNCPKS